MPTSTKTPPAKRVAKKAAPAPAPTPVKVNGRGQIQVRLPQDLIDRLDEEADRRRVSKTFLVEDILSANLGAYEEQVIGTTL